MRIAILGNESPVSIALRTTLKRLGHEIVTGPCECAIYIPGCTAQLEDIVQHGGFGRIVLRSHAFAYGSRTKNPGMMTEQRLSVAAPNAPEQRWLELEAIAAKHPNATIIRLTNVLAVAEGDLIVRQLSRSSAVTLAGHDPNVQFVAVEDAAEILAVAACTPTATGIFNAAGPGAIPLKKAFRAAGTRPIPIPLPLARLGASGRSVEQMQYNWTVAAERAERELGWRARRSTTEALGDFLVSKPGSRPHLLQPSYDEWGLDTEYVKHWAAWFWFLRNVYWRIDSEGMENIPASGRALFVSNHRGFMPLDAVMHLSLIFKHRRRIPRFLIIHSLLRFPYLCNFLTKLGGVLASQENAARLFAREDIVGIFPEGIRGSFTPYNKTYQLRDFSKSGFAKMAIQNQADIVPAAVIGHSEIFPIVGRINSSYVTREWGWPYLPIAPMFPVAPIPLPSKWHVRVLPPVRREGLKPSDAENHRLVKEFSREIQHLLQQNIDEMLSRRKHIFWGKVLGGTAAVPARVRVSRPAGDTR